MPLIGIASDEKSPVADRGSRDVDGRSVQLHQGMILEGGDDRRKLALDALAEVARADVPVLIKMTKASASRARPRASSASRPVGPAAIGG